PRGEDPLEIIREIESGIEMDRVIKVIPEELSWHKGERCFTLLPDREKAIELAVGIAGPNDTVLIAGKGHEDYQIVGDKRLSFDDRKVSREALDARRNG
ncbi:MAG TPA: hypothetical protein VI728_05435, partial [Syntrophales bacterium]|nr:hypothetical protein [Syntrophales bacterium]